MTTLNEHLAAMVGGDKLGLSAEDGGTFVVTYDAQGAVGDNGEPVEGDTTGDFTLYTGDLDDPGAWRFVMEAHVAPHGTSGHGNRYAKDWAADKIADRVTRRRAGVAGR